MRFSIHQTGLKETLDKIVGVIPSKSTLPVLDCVRLKIEGEKARATATDLNAWLLTFVGCNNGDGEAEILVPGKKLYEVVNLMPQEQVEFDVQDKSINLKCKNVRHRISMINAEDYPKEPYLLKEDGYIAVPRAGLQVGLGAVAFATAKDETSLISGILFDLKKDKLKLVATDGHRLAVYSIPVNTELEHKVIVPSYAAKHVSKMEGEEVRMFIDDNFLGLYASNLGLTSRLLQGEYPPYEKAIPQDNDKQLIANRRELIHALRQVDVFARDSNGLIEVEIDTNADRFILTAKGEGFESQANVGCQYQGDSIKIIVNSRYLLQNLYAMPSEKIEWTFKTPVSAMVLKPRGEQDYGEYLYLLMPVRI
jgi:DNA polymerase-3 subunit beta